LPAKIGYFLQVRNAHVAVLTREGRVYDVIQPGTHELTQATTPRLVESLGAEFDPDSAFEAHVYFVSTGEHAGVKWGTPNGIIAQMRTQGTVILQAFGSYTIQVVDPPKLVSRCAAFGDDLPKEFGSHLRYRLTTVIGQVVSELARRPRTSLADLISSADAIAKAAQTRLQPEFRDFGLVLMDLYVHNLGLHSISLEQLWQREQEQLRNQQSGEASDAPSRLLLRYRVSTAILVAVLGIALVAFQPLIAPWPWLSSHPRALGLRLCVVFALLGLSWTIWDQDTTRRRVALSSVVLAAIAVFLQIV
jgi:membrane protease subunit (stomatin/prohibitin family)